MSELIQLKGIDRSDERRRVESLMSENQTSIVSPQPAALHPQSPTIDPQSSLDPRATGKRYWRSLEELAETDEFQEMLHREFPERASEWTDPVGRRRFLKLM